MDNEPEKTGGSAKIALLGVACVACCAAPFLIAGGVLSGIGAWFLKGGLVWLVVAAAFIGAGLVLWRRRWAAVDAGTDMTDASSPARHDALLRPHDK